MKLAALLIFASFPFVGAVLLGWFGPKLTWAAHYRHARERTAALAAEADAAHARVMAAGARVLESERRLAGETWPGAAPPPGPGGGDGSGPRSPVR